MTAVARRIEAVGGSTEDLPPPLKAHFDRLGVTTWSGVSVEIGPNMNLIHIDFMPYARVDLASQNGLPGEKMRAALGPLLGSRIVVDVVDPVIADIHCEWSEAVLFDRADLARQARWRAYALVLWGLVAYAWARACEAMRGMIRTRGD